MNNKETSLADAFHTVAKARVQELHAEKKIALALFLESIAGKFTSDQLTPAKFTKQLIRNLVDKDLGKNRLNEPLKDELLNIRKKLIPA